VALGPGSRVIGSTVTNSILGNNVRVRKAIVEGALVGDDQIIQNQTVKDAVMDAGEVAPAN
jgi:ADP-glucose pyrophosphorylase